MAEFKVLLTDNVTIEALAVFERYENIDAVRTGTLPPDDLKKTIADFDAVVVRSPTKLTAEVIDAATQLKFIGRTGAGVDNIDVGAATKRGIVVMNSPSGNTVSTAEHTVALILALARRIPHAHRSVTGGEWDRTSFLGLELWGKTLGIIGLGRVGGEVARRMGAFGMKVLACDPYVDPGRAVSLGVELVDTDTLLGDSRVVTVHVPLTRETRNLIGETEIGKMLDGVLLVNCSRGGVVSEEVLLAALESGKVAGAALDVYENEPPGDHPLFAHPRCVFTPHLGGATAEARVRAAVEAAEAVAEALASGVIRNAVNRIGG